MNSRDILARNLKKLFDYKGLKAYGAAKMCDVSQPKLDAILKSKRDVGIDTLDSLAALFELQPWHLLLEDLDPANPPPIKPLTDAERAFYDTIRAAATKLK